MVKKGCLTKDGGPVKTPGRRFLLCGGELVSFVGADAHAVERTVDEGKRHQKEKAGENVG